MGSTMSWRIRLQGDENQLIAMLWFNRTDTPLRWDPEGPGARLTQAMLGRMMADRNFTFDQIVWNFKDITDSATAKYSGPRAPCLETLQLTVAAYLAQFRIRATATAHKRALERAHRLAESSKHFNGDL
jgi:hypothetical protein